MKVIIRGFVGLLFVSSVFAQSHVYRQIVRSVPDTTGYQWYSYDIYRMASPNDYRDKNNIGSGCAFSSSGQFMRWFTDASDGEHPWTNGDTLLIIGSLDTAYANNPSTYENNPNHTGFYWLFSDTLDATQDPQTWLPDDTLRVMPLPIASQSAPDAQVIVELENPRETDRPPWGTEEYDVLGFWLIADTSGSGTPNAFDVEFGFVPVDDGPGDITFFTYWPADYFWTGEWDVYHAYHLVARPDTTSGGAGDSLCPGFRTLYMSQNSNMLTIPVENGVPVPDTVPPLEPYVYCSKSGNDVQLVWHPITVDTLGYPETVHEYFVYRDTAPGFVPEGIHLIGRVYPPDTSYTDSGALNLPQSHYYVIKSIDTAIQKSGPSNIGYKFAKFVNENPTTTDKNWTSLPWHNDYVTVSDMTNDLSPAGNPLVKISRLRDDQFYESWLWDDLFLEWVGTDYPIDTGCAYSLITAKDSSLFLVGSNKPDGLVWLNENSATTDKNWVSIPYNAVYNTVSDITDEYSPGGDPLIKITNRRNSQYFENWLWDDIFLEWYGANFDFEIGRGYEFVTIVDTTWDPTEYSNEAGKGYGAPKGNKENRVVTHVGTALTTDRAPVWMVGEVSSADEIVRSRSAPTEHSSHIVRCYIQKSDDVVFTAYRPSKPHDALTEKMVGSGIVQKDGIIALWFDVGNFKTPWQSGEEVIVIVEAIKDGEALCNVISIELDETVDIQDVGQIELVTISKLIAKNENITGFSKYRGKTRLNDVPISSSELVGTEDIDMRAIVRGGYETVYSTDGRQSRQDEELPIAYSFKVSPNPFVRDVQVEYALPHQSSVDITIYDASGRKVCALLSKDTSPGYYTISWLGGDDTDRRVPSGVYFVRFESRDYTETRKILLLK